MLFLKFSMLPFKIFLFGLLVLAISAFMCYILSKKPGKVPTVLGNILLVLIGIGLTAVWIGLTFG